MVAVPATLRSRLQSLERGNKIKRELPWDCKNLMSLYETEIARRSIIYKLFDLKGEDCENLEPYRIGVEATMGLSQEALEFLSLSAERQEEAVHYYYPPGPPLTEEEREELTRKFLEKLYGTRDGGSF